MEAALAAGAGVSELFCLANDETGPALAAGRDIAIVTPEALARLSGTRTPQSPVAVVEIPAPDDLRPRATLVLWGVGDPGNAGTLLRTAAAFDLDVAVAGSATDLWSPKVLRAGGGSHFGLNLARADMARLRAAGLEVIASVPRGGTALWEAPLPETPALVVGDEAGGLPDDVLAAAATTVTIPMAAGTESLNVGVAGALLAYEWRRRRAGRP